MRTLGQVLAEIFGSRPPSTGNPDVDELRLYNYLAEACDLCSRQPAHLHGEIRHCDACCRAAAARTVRDAEARTQGGSQGRGA